MKNAQERDIKEAEHFKDILDSTGTTWWGNKTIVGQYRQDRRADLALTFFNPSKGDTILDLGCGVGIFTVKLAKTSATIIGIDITEASIQFAQKNNLKDNIEYITGSAYNLPFEDNSIDYITGNAVLHHFDLNKALPEMKRILKEGGKIIFFEPNMLNPQIFLEKKVRCIGKMLQNTEDETAFYKKEIQNILIKLGFVDVQVTPFDFMHPIIPGVFLQPLKLLNCVLEKTPIVREIGGSLIIKASKGNGIK